LDYFVVYSSVTTLLGNPGQANYVAANAFLENLMYLRRQQNLLGFYVAWGAIEDVGYLARNTNVRESLISKMGMSVLTSKKALDILEQYLLEQDKHAGVIISDLNQKTVKRLAASGSNKFSLLMKNADNADAEHDERQLDIHQQIADGTLTESSIIHLLSHEIGKILYIAPEKIDSSESLTNMGMDSLMGVELANAIEQSFGVTIPILALSQNPTIEKLAKNLFAQLSKVDADEEQQNDKEMQAMMKLAQQHGEVVTDKYVEVLTA
jgi:acyl carrier protein